MNPREPGAYVLGFELRTEAMQVKISLPSEANSHWKEIWPEQAAKFRKLREQAEREARAEGKEIDTRYEDPPVLAMRSGG